jgi:hypothetical protein
VAPGTNAYPRCSGLTSPQVCVHMCMPCCLELVAPLARVDDMRLWHVIHTRSGHRHHWALPCVQEPTRCLGNIPPTVRAVGNTTTPKTVEGELQLTQALNGPLATPGREHSLSHLLPCFLAVPQVLQP